MARNKSLCDFCFLLSVKDLNFLRRESSLYGIDHWQFKSGKNAIFLGRNVVKVSILEAADIVLKRDFSRLANFDGSSESHIGCVVISGHPHDDDFSNRIVEIIENYFEKREEDCLVVTNLRISDRVFDFLIVNYTNHYILNIQEFMGKNVLKSTELQDMAENKRIFEKLLENSIRGKWNYFFSIFYETKDPSLKPCSSCKAFIVQNKIEFINMLDTVSNYWQIMKTAMEMNQKLAGQSPLMNRKLKSRKESLKMEIDKMKSQLRAHSESQRFPSDFVIICQRLLIHRPLFQLPLKGSLVRLTKNLSKDHWTIWIYPTPRQLDFWSSPKVVLLSPWGTGRSFSIFLKAFNLASLGNKVLVLMRKSFKISLITLDMFERFKEFPKVKIIEVSGPNDFWEALETFDYEYVFIDELCLNFQNEEKLMRFIASKEFSWIGIPSFAKSFHFTLEEEAQLIQNQFPNFDISYLRTFIRQPMDIASMIQKGLGEGFDNLNSLNSKLVSNAIVPRINDDDSQNIMRLGTGSNGLPLEDCFKTIFEQNLINFDDYAIIVIDDDPNSLENWTTQKILRCQCQEKIHILWIDEALKKSGRPQPLFHTQNLSNTYEDLTQWILGNRKQDLVISLDLVKGFEHDIIIDPYGYLETASRSTDKLFKIATTRFLDKIPICLNLNEHEHDCNSIMDRNLRPDFNKSMLSLIDDAQSMTRFTRSQSLPTPQGYHHRFINPILECIADQTRQDRTTWKWKNFTGQKLLDQVLRAFERNELDWPEFTSISCSDWVRAMKEDSNFYLFLNCDLYEFQEYEEVLLEVLSSFLKRPIKVIPFLEEDKEMEFQPLPRPSNIKIYHLLYCDRLRHGNFYVSVFPKE